MEIKIKNKTHYTSSIAERYRGHEIMSVYQILNFGFTNAKLWTFAIKLDGEYIECLTIEIAREKIDEYLDK